MAVQDRDNLEAGALGIGEVVINVALRINDSGLAV
jgi:hypothetical protein